MKEIGCCQLGVYIPLLKLARKITKRQTDTQTESRVQEKNIVGFPQVMFYDSLLKLFPDKNMVGLSRKCNIYYVFIKKNCLHRALVRPDRQPDSKRDRYMYRNIEQLPLICINHSLQVATTTLRLKQSSGYLVSVRMSEQNLAT